MLHITYACPVMSANGTFPGKHLYGNAGQTNNISRSHPHNPTPNDAILLELSHNCITGAHPENPKVNIYIWSSDAPLEPVVKVYISMENAVAGAVAEGCQICYKRKC